MSAIRWGASAMRILFSILVSILMLAGTSVEAQGLTREQAVAALTNTSVQARRDAASRLGDVGVMADVAALAKLLRDTDEDTRDNAEQSLWRIWARSGNPEICDERFAACF